MTRLSSFSGLGLLRALLLVCAASALQAQTITTFDPPNSTNTIPSAINVGGQIAGSYFTGGGLSHGFIRRHDGFFLTFDASPDGFTLNAAAVDINSAGVVAGSYFYLVDQESFLRQPDGTIVHFYPSLPQAAAPHALARTGANFGCTPLGDSEAVAINDVGQTIGDFGSVGCYGFVRRRDGGMVTFSVTSQSHPTDIPQAHPQAINVLGQIAGYYGEDDVVTQYGGFLRQPTGGIVRFFPPNSIYTVPTSINVLGQITGYYQDANFVVHGFLRQTDGTITTFDPDGSTDTEAYSMNAVGTITGFYLGADGVHHGFLRAADGTFTTFDVSGSQGTYAKSINSSGQVTGYYFDGTSYHGFVRSNSRVVRRPRLPIRIETRNR